MKIVKIQTAYPSYLAQFYERRPELRNQDYAEQKRALDEDAFGWADFWGHAFRQLGHGVEEFLANAEPLQRAWARENDFPEAGDSWMLEIAKEQVVRSKAEILFLVDYENFPASWVREVRRACPSLRLVAGYCGAPFSDPTVFAAYDIVLSDTLELVEQFEKAGHKAYRIYHGFDPRILDRVGRQAPKEMDFTFIGSIVRGNAFHLEREKILERLVEQPGIEIFCPAKDVNLSEQARFFGRRAAYALASALRGAGLSSEAVASIPKLSRAAYWAHPPLYPVNLRLKPKMHPPVYGLDMFRLLRASRATFNCHINVSPRTANNIRLYEATGMGACLVTDWKENISDLFVPDKEVVTYRSPDECVEKMTWLLSHPDKLEEIALAGQARTLRDYSWRQRAERVAEIFRENMP